MIALILGGAPDENVSEITELLDRVQRPATIRLLYCQIEFGPAGHLTFDDGWRGVIDWCHIGLPADDGPNVVLVSCPGIEIDWRGTPGNLLPVTVQQLAEETARQRRALGYDP